LAKRTCSLLCVDECPICSRGKPLDIVGEGSVTWFTAASPSPMLGYLCVVSKRHVVEPFELQGSERAAFWEETLKRLREPSEHHEVSVEPDARRSRPSSQARLHDVKDRRPWVMWPDRALPFSPFGVNSSEPPHRLSLGQPGSAQRVRARAPSLTSRRVLPRGGARGLDGSGVRNRQ
jgi:hypothetical protein